MEPKEHLIHAVAFQHGAHWVAQCLEYDIATQAATPDELIYELERIVSAHFVMAAEENAEPFVAIPKAPRRFWEMYRRARAKVRTLSATELPPSAQLRPTFQLAFSQPEAA